MSTKGMQRTWGITPGYWLWSTRIKILFVIDGIIDLSKSDAAFGLGYVLETLRAPVFFYAGFKVDVAKRDGPLESEQGYTSYSHFKFTDSHFTLEDYDQVWFFGHHPHMEAADDFTTDADIAGHFELDDAELKRLAEWMDRGGGVFATGDHGLLGASMCSRIPRVRTMRRWTRVQEVPARSLSSRHETLQPTSENPMAQEGDTLLQPLELVYSLRATSLPFGYKLLPHPVLSTPQGAIARFPDHMHEGEVIDDDAVELDRPLGIAGYDRPEYPSVVPVILESGPGIPQPLRRPRPQVIAYGRAMNPTVIDTNTQRALASAPPHGGVALGGQRFGVVGVYDGDPAGLGRVVVDSTWHHWFSLNLVGIAEQSSPDYAAMQAYYRNVGLWLSPHSQRQLTLVAATWGVLASSVPMAFAKGDGPWQVGARVIEILGKTTSSLMLGEWVASLLEPNVAPVTSPTDIRESEPSWSALPSELINRALVGGIGSALLDLALDHRLRRSRGERPRLDRDAIASHAAKGVALGHALLRHAVDDAVTMIGTAQAQLAAPVVARRLDLQLPIEVRSLCVVAETLQCPDPADPALIGRRLAITVRVRLDDAVVAHHTFDDLKVPHGESRGAVVRLDRDIGTFDVQSGETLSVEVLVGRGVPEASGRDVLRFQDTLHGDVSTWIGQHTPARSQAWRLWYHVEEIAGIR